MELVTSLISGVFGLIFFIIEFILIIYALLDIFKNPNFTLNTKLLWVIIIVLIPILGSLLYIFWGATKVSCSETSCLIRWQMNVRW